MVSVRTLALSLYIFYELKNFIVTAEKINTRLMSYDMFLLINISAVNCTTFIPSETISRMRSLADLYPQSQFSIPTSYLFACLNAITYEKSIPAFAFSNQSTISFTIDASEVIVMDSQNNLVFKALVDMWWYDPRLQWSLDFVVPQWVWPMSVVRDVSWVWYPVF